MHALARRPQIKTIPSPFGQGVIHYASTPVEEVPLPQSFLSAGELKKFGSFPLEKRRNDWLAARWVAKYLIGKLLGGGVDLSGFEILNDDDGRPILRYPQTPAQRWSISVAHSGGMSAAAVDISGNPLGLDLEVIEERHPAWNPVAFHRDELRDELGASELTRLWTVKEAVLKLLGLGLRADLHEVRMRPELTLYGKTLERHRAMGSPPIRLVSWQQDRFWVTVATAGSP